MKEINGKIGWFTSGVCEIERNGFKDFSIKRCYMRGLGKATPYKSWTVFGPSNFECMIHDVNDYDDNEESGVEVTIRCTYTYHLVLPIAMEKKLGTAIFPDNRWDGTVTLV